MAPRAPRVWMVVAHRRRRRSPLPRHWVTPFDCVGSVAGATATAAAYRDSIVRVYEPLSQSVNVTIGLLTRNQPLPGTFAPTVKGRIRPLGTFTTLADTIEYFGLPALVGLRLVSLTVSQLVVSPPYAYAKLDFVVSPAAGSNATGRSTHVGTWRFDEAGLITGYDLEYPGLTPMLASFGLDYSSRPVVDTLIPPLCGNIAAACTGRNAAYASEEECVTYLSSLPVRRMEQGNLAACRAFHAPLTVFRPDVHCPHVSAAGGGKCIDLPFESMYKDDVEVLAYPWLSPALPAAGPRVEEGGARAQ